MVVGVLRLFFGLCTNLKLFSGAHRETAGCCKVVVETYLVVEKYTRDITILASQTLH